MMRCEFAAMLGFAACLIFPGSPAMARTAPFKPGETIRYAIKQAAVKVGEASLVFKGEQEVDGKKLALVIFTSRGFNFFDEERIFLDPDTYLPRTVVRDLNIFGSREKITEEYEAGGKGIKVTKISDGKTTVKTIAKNGDVDNIYGFIYRYRRQGEFRKDEKFDLRLPTLDVTMQDVGDVSFNAAGKTYLSALLRSVPAKYSVWIDKSDLRLPLRIAGAVGIANTVMTMIGYEP
ncbi:MAG: hypothetical protein WCI27_03805 [Candidatus Omnitrophota bacterium]